eukprot:TRINITY_DN26916_c0_g1_i1.p1 TRINITY_DN26916_c0_g1~~TRINITY_DN26916_c0_g1_i1.p1  ORF type:complete len:223 (+),score=49.43 TRINITY_DN26916_c0_g1_i1:86-670(+)
MFDDEEDDIYRTNMKRLHTLGTGDSFLTSDARPMWFYREGGLYHPYDPSLYSNLSTIIEDAFQSTEGMGIVEQTVKCKINKKDVEKNFKFNFDDMTSIMEGASKPKVIMRGLWFFEKESGVLYPFPPETAARLENSFVLAKATKSSFRVPVDGHKYVLGIDTSNGTYNNFKQFKIGGKSEGRRVFRGYHEKGTF